jgi:putative transcriptional regulator
MSKISTQCRLTGPFDVFSTLQPERQNPMSDANITRFKLDPNHPPKTDWSAVDKLTDDEIHAAALSDPDAQPATPEQLARARRTVNVQLIREKFGLSQEQFARRFGLRLEMLRGWEDRTLTPDPAAVTLLRVIWAEPEAVRRVVAAE